MNITDSHQRMNNLRVFGAIKPDYIGEPRAFILECKAKRILRAKFDYNKEMIEIGLGYKVTADRVIDKIMRVDEKKLTAFLALADDDIVLAVVGLIRKKRPVN